MCNTKTPVTLKPLSHTNTNLFADCGATRKKPLEMLIWLARLVFTMHSPRIPLSWLWNWQRPTKMIMCHFCRATRKTPKNLDAVDMHLPCIRWAFDNVAHLPCIWLAFAHIGVRAPTEKSIRFLPSLLFFITGNGGQRFVGQTSITSIFFKYTVCGKKGKIKNQAPPGDRNYPPPPPQISSPGYGPAWRCPCMHAFLCTSHK